MEQPWRVGVGGALGRMGQAVVAAAAARDDLVLAGRFDRGGLLDDRGAVLAGCDAVVDFSTPEATLALVEAARAEARRPALVLGATGFSPGQEASIARAAADLVIVKSGNFSIGVNVLAALVEQAARRLGRADWDIELVEAHHRRKVDAPSGTALLLATAAARGRNEHLADVRLPPRDGVTGERPVGAIGFSSLRGGGLVGEHSVLFAAEDETITLSHAASSRALFAKGALAAAAWTRGRPPGLYGMADVLGF